MRQGLGVFERATELALDMLYNPVACSNVDYFVLASCWMEDETRI